MIRDPLYNIECLTAPAYTKYLTPSAVPAFGYKNHLGIDRRHRLIRNWAVTDAARHDGALLPDVIDPM
jgi:hypothetical protein